MKPQLIAYYLPQYHPIPENNKWWGQGFTEWTNVVKAKPFFKNHLQPKLPADLGFYDLRLAEVRQNQADMAQMFGLDGFCYYHYWFGDGRQILNRPFDEILSSGQPDFPFMLCWANQSWTGHWFGAENRMLIEQKYPDENDTKAHIKYLLPAFLDKRYIKFEGKPVFKILDVNYLKSPKLFTSMFRAIARDYGISDIYLIAGNFTPSTDWNPLDYGFDALTDDTFIRTRTSALNHKKKSMNKLIFNKLTAKFFPKSIYFKHSNTITMREYVDRLEFPNVNFPLYPIVIPNWDNTPRALGKGIVITDDDPGLFYEQLCKANEYLKPYVNSSFVFIKSWNEWAEGNKLEPDVRTGMGYLEALRNFSIHSNMSSSNF